MRALDVVTGGHAGAVARSTEPKLLAGAPNVPHAPAVVWLQDACLLRYEQRVKRCPIGFILAMDVPSLVEDDGRCRCRGCGRRRGR